MIDKEKHKIIRVLILPSWFPPDGGEFFEEQALNLSSEHTEVHILVNRLCGIRNTGISGLLLAYRTEETATGAVRIIWSGTAKWPGLERLNMLRWNRRYLQLFRRYKKKYGMPDLVLAHSAVWAGYTAACIKERWKIPLILVEHRSRFASDTEAARAMIPGWYEVFLKKALGSADRVVTVSPSLFGQLTRIQPEIKHEPVSVPNMVDTDFFCLPAASRSDSPYRILFIGLLEKVKGVDVLLHALAELLKTGGKDVRLSIAGSGSSEIEYRILSEELDLSGHVEFLGKISREKVRDEMQKASVFVLPSRFEAFGVVLIEAMATGCPVVSTYSGGPAHIVSDDCGLLVQPDDSMELAKALGKIRQDYKSYDPEKIRKQATERYSGEKIREAYEVLINEIINESGSSGL